MESTVFFLLGSLLIVQIQANSGPSAAGGMNYPSGPPSGAGGKPGPTSGKPPAGMGGMNMGTGSGMNYNLNTMQGILAFLNMEGINPNTLITTNCTPNGQQCNSAKPCCFSPVLSCQGICRVVPAHVNHVPQIRQILQTVGITTQNPVQ